MMFLYRIVCKRNFTHHTVSSSCDLVSVLTLIDIIDLTCIVSDRILVNVTLFNIELHCQIERW